MEPGKLQRCLKEYTEACRIEVVHFHTLRHTFATRCAEVGFDMKTLSEILGHSNISVTLNQYVHPNLEQKRENMCLTMQGCYGWNPLKNAQVFGIYKFLNCGILK